MPGQYAARRVRKRRGVDGVPAPSLGAAGEYQSGANDHKKEHGARGHSANPHTPKGKCEMMCRIGRIKADVGQIPGFTRASWRGTPRGMEAFASLTPSASRP